jgi:hypothetical protein
MNHILMVGTSAPAATSDEDDFLFARVFLNRHFSFLRRIEARMEIEEHPVA